MLDEERLIELLKQTAKLLEYVDENKFKILAYVKASEIIESYEGKFFELFNSGQYKKISGIGKGMQEFIKEFAETNSSIIYEELRHNAPKEFFEMLKIKGLGIKKIKSIYTDIKIETINDLEEACRNKKLMQVKGITEKFCIDIINEIKRIKRDKNKLLLNKAEKIADLFKQEFNKHFPDLKLVLTGELNRNMEVVSLIDFVLFCINKEDFINNSKNYFNITNIEEFDYYTQIIINHENKANIYLYLTNSEYSLNKLRFEKNGSEEFINHINKQKLEINFNDERLIFKQLGINYLNPELREVEILDYLDRLDFYNPLEEKDIKSLIHFHTTWSDGLSSVEEMAINALNLGLNYFVVSDHSKTPVYANGLNENRVLAQKEEIELLRKDMNLNIFHGIESDILPDGNLDYDVDFLNNFDFVIASVHNKFDLKKEEMTSRIIKAIENPFTDVIGHLTGRILLRRNPYELDIYKILDACVVNDVGIEINASPSRLDLDWRYMYYARDKGVRFYINPDAHSVSEIEMIKYGVKIARKAGIKKEEVINCMCIEDFIKHINRKVNRKITWSKNGIERVN
ncbi:MAG TPA: PHP domain-containing protein [Melioribacteraceae bacterium]|nr:PHP domain-containing protein [Melioribacteraceae bacterium]